MNTPELMDKAFAAMKNADKKTEFYAGASAAAIDLLQAALARENLPPLPADYLYFLSQSSGCRGPYFTLYGIFEIDVPGGNIQSDIIDGSPHFNRFEDDDDIESKGLIIGRMPARMLIAYKEKQYHVLDEDSYLPLESLHHHIADFITETTAAWDAAERKRAAEKSQKS